MGNIVIDAAVPLRNPAPAEATHPAHLGHRGRMGRRRGTLLAHVGDAPRDLATPEGIPVRGGAGEMTVPLALVRGREIGCGGAKAMPTPNRFGYLGVIYVRGQSSARHSSNGFAV